MDILTLEKFKELINEEENYCISMYMPTNFIGVDIKQNPIRLKQLIKKAEDKLTSMYVENIEIEKILKPISSLIDDKEFWRNQTEGLVIFSTTKEMKYYHIPYEVKEDVLISDKFYTKPLIPIFTGDGEFYILALSKNEVRLFKATRQMVKEIKMEGAPRSMHDMQVDYDPKTNLLIRTSNTQGRTSELNYNNASQGQGNENDFEKNELSRYFRAIDESLNKLNNEENIPLVLAGVEYLIPIFKEISSYPNIIDEFIKGNPETLYGEDLQKLAWELMEPKFLKIQELAEAKYKQYSGQRNKLFSNSLKKIVTQAYNGQIETLFIADGVNKWGKFNPNDSKVEIYEEEKVGSEDLLDYVATTTISRGGSVYIVDADKVPDGGVIAAILRY